MSNTTGTPAAINEEPVMELSTLLHTLATIIIVQAVGYTFKRLGIFTPSVEGSIGICALPALDPTASLFAQSLSTTLTEPKAV